MAVIKRVRLSEIAELVTKGTTPTTLGYEFQDTGVNFLKIECFSEKGDYIQNKATHISEECHEKLKRSQLKEGDILFSIAGVIGRVAIVTRNMLPANINQALAIIRIKKDDIYLPYVKLILTSPLIKKQFERKKQGVAQLNISLKDINDLEIPLPEIGKQIEYANSFKKVEKLIYTRQYQLQKLDELVKARFVEMFGDPVENTKAYYVATLQELICKGYITYHLDGNHGSDYPKSDEFVEAGTPYISANCIVNGEVDFSKAKYLTLERANKLRKGIAQNEDVLFAHNATVGPTVVLHTTKEKVILGTSLTAYRCNKEKILPSYLKTYMLSDGFIRQYSNEMKQTTRNQVPITAQKKYLFLIPPIGLQNQFATFVNQVDKSKVAVQKSLDEAQLLFDSLMQQYFE
ncbi:restriction endonuclease subunit S [Gemmiger sp.]